MPSGVTIQVKRFPPDLWQRVRIHAVITRRNIRDVVLEAIREYLGRHESQVDHAP